LSVNSGLACGPAGGCFWSCAFFSFSSMRGNKDGPYGVPDWTSWVTFPINRQPSTLGRFNAFCCPGIGSWRRSNWRRSRLQPNTIAVLRIELEDIKPLIWRRVAVPTSMNVKSVHDVIQAVMGWLDCHLWEFEADGRKYSLLISNDPWNELITDAASTALSSLVRRWRRQTIGRGGRGSAGSAPPPG
jgi:hypothetical protein